MECVKADINNRRTIFTKESIPQIEDNYVIVKVAFSGVCGTDLHIIDGKFDAKNLNILGHETVGTVHDISPTYPYLKKGDRVAIDPNRNCGFCIPCRRKKSNFCKGEVGKEIIGIFVNGGWAEYCKAHISVVCKLPDSLSLRQAVICEPLSCIIHGLDILPDLEIGYDILIIGAGIIGLLWSCLLHLLGHRNVIISEPNEERRNTLNKLDLGFKCLPWNEVLKLQELNSHQVDLCIDCSGNINAIQAAFPMFRECATLLLFGVSAPEKTLIFHPFELYKKEIKVIGSKINTPNSFERAISIMEGMSDRYLQPEKLNMKFFPLRDHEKALESFCLGTYSKIIFEV